MSLNLVNYSDSSSDEEIQDQETATKLKSKLPNPFGNSIKVNEEEVDDEAKHDGRTRIFPHERGNWVTYIYAHCPKTDSITELEHKILNLISSTHTLEAVKFHAIEELHMSLTRTVTLRHHWIDEFIRSIGQSLKNSNRFFMNLNSIRVYCNDNETRTFISIAFANDNLNATQNLRCIVNQLNSCLSEFKLPPFYEEASFHVSLLWCLGDRRKELQPLLPQLCSYLEHLSSMDDSNFTFNIEQLFCKIGNKLYNFHL